MKPIYSSIPVELCKYALTESKPNHLKLLVYLKHVASGHVRMDTSLYKYWAVDLNVSERWIRDAIVWMIKNKWISVNNKKQSLRIVSYLQICRRLNLKCNLAAKFDGYELSTFKSFCCAVSLAYFIRRKNYVDKNRRSVSKMADTRKSRNRNPKGYSTLPVRYFAKCLGVSASTANNYKKLAERSRFISVKRQITNFTNSGDVKITKDLLPVLMHDEDAIGRLRIGRKYLKFVDCDLIKLNIICGRKCFRNGEKM